MGPDLRGKVLLDDEGLRLWMDACQEFCEVACLLGQDEALAASENQDEKAVLLPDGSLRIYVETGELGTCWVDVPPEHWDFAPPAAPGVN